MKKKLLFVVVALALVLSACSKGGNENVVDKKIDIGIIQIIEHEALDRARKGFEDRIKELGIDANISYKSAQGDLANAKQIAEKFANDKVDLIYAIATPSAEAALAVTSEIPVLFSAVTDPVDAKLVASNEKPGGNASGTSDAADVEGQLAMLKEIDPEIKKLGVLYSADEQNSYSQVKEIKEITKKLGLELVETSIQNISDLPQASESMAKKVDAFYLLSDNKIASSVSLLTDVAKRYKLPTVCIEGAHVRAGGLISKGINYYTLGQQTAEMAKKVLVDGVKVGDIPVEWSRDNEKVINLETLKELELDENLPVFKDAKDINSIGE